jgi:hypothetical protein
VPSQSGTPTPKSELRKRAAHTDARGDGRAALLVAFGTAVAGDAGHAVLAGTLASGLVAGFASSTHGVAITGCEEHTTEESREREGSPPCPGAFHGPHSRGRAGRNVRPGQAHTSSRNSRT